MKTTYYVPTDKEHQDELQETVRQLFQVEPSITQRATDVKIDFDSLDSLADLLGAEVIETPHVVFTLEDATQKLTLEQQAFLLSYPEATISKDYTPEEVIRDYLDEEE
jgi:hypothetical protein